MAMSGLSQREGRKIILDKFVFAGQKTVVAIMTFGHINHQVPLFHFYV
jgi:hypothetical protein